MKSKKILLVDDDEIVHLTFQHLLVEKGFDVDIAQSGEEAIDKLSRNSSYDLVITDLRMHGATGVDVLIKTREINEKICVMIMSGFGGESPLFKDAMKLKPCSHAFKPLSEKEFLEKVHSCLEKAI